MNIGIINSNLLKIGKSTKKGTEIFAYIFITNLYRMYKKNVKATIFASGNSKFSYPTISLNYKSSIEDTSIGQSHNRQYEDALIAKAFSMQKKFDLYHINIASGELVLPFVQFIKKPVVITIHGDLSDPFLKKYWQLFTQLKNVYFVSISNSQRKPIPGLPYIRTIYHGININSLFKFNNKGGNSILWTGRAIPEKGLDTVLTVIKKTRKNGKIFPIIKDEYIDWLRQIIEKRSTIVSEVIKIYTDFDVNRNELIQHYQLSKLFLLPLEWEEPFGLVLIESMACGTPVVAFARGSVPEIVKDGETGFIVNSSDTDIRGDWIIKKTGIEGLCEAVERIYAMPEDKYQAMRFACRKHVEANFTVERMVNEYVEVYKQLTHKT